MGYFIENMKMTVALLSIEDVIADRIRIRLATEGANDPGRFEVYRCATLPECYAALDNAKAHAICIGIQQFSPDEISSFIANVRIAFPLVPICIVGTRKFLDELPGFRTKWREKLEHYFKIVSDDNANIDNNIGCLRDLFAADSIKTRALDSYRTTPGHQIVLIQPYPPGFKLWVAVNLTVAVVSIACVVYTAFSK